MVEDERNDIGKRTAIAGKTCSTHERVFRRVSAVRRTLRHLARLAAGLHHHSLLGTSAGTEPGRWEFDRRRPVGIHLRAGVGGKRGSLGGQFTAQTSSVAPTSSRHAS